MNTPTLEVVFYRTVIKKSQATPQAELRLAESRIDF